MLFCSVVLNALMVSQIISILFKIHEIIFYLEFCWLCMGGEYNRFCIVWDISYNHT